MSKLYSYSNNGIHQKNNYYLLSSWNYGSYSPTNPFYNCHYYTSKPDIKSKPNSNNKKTFPRSTTAAQLNSINKPFYQCEKRHLKEEERIVTNEYLYCFNHYNKMQEHLKKGTFRPKSVNRILSYNIIRENESESKNGQKRKKLKSDTSDYKYKMTFSEWIKVKNKQRAIFKEIIRKRKDEEEIIEEENKNIDNKYQEIKNQKFKEWLKKKAIEFIVKKEIEKKEEMRKEEEKKEKEEKKEEVMNNWFKVQAKKMEKEISEKKEKIIMEKEKENLKKIEEKQKKILNRKAFKEWREKKEKEIKKRKKEEKIQKQKEEEKKKRDYLKKKVKRFTIGPYTDAAALKEFQNILVEKNLIKEEDGFYKENS